MIAKLRKSAGIPAPIVNRLSQEIIDIVNEPAMHKRLVDKGIDPLPQGPADFRNFAINYYQANKRVADAAKITMD